MDLLEFYGLKEDPFRLTPDPTYFFASSNHNEALLSMNYVVEQREGFCLVLGEPGTGKTTLLNVFRQKWKDKAEIALILTPRLSPEDFLLTVLDDLGVKRPEAANKNDILKAFRDFLVERSLDSRPVIIIVDEAQNMPDETLEELRLLSNLETEKNKLMQIILIGQPELGERLQKDVLRQLNQRITVRITLHSLSSNETLDYINYRLIKAGKGFLKLDEKLLRPIHKFSAGVPRIINILSSRAIMSAYLEGSNVVNINHVKYAVKHLKESAQDGAGIRQTNLMYILAVIALIFLGAASGFYYLSGHKDSSVEAGKADTQAVAAAPVTQGIVKEKSAEQMQKVRESSAQGSEPAPLKRYIVVSVDIANIRTQPGIEGQKVAAAYRGEKIEIKGETTGSDGSKWYNINVYDDKEAWVSGRVVTLIKP